MNRLSSRSVAKSTFYLVSVVVLLHSCTLASLADVVYDSLPFKQGGSGINGDGTTGNQVGQSIRLSGGMRQVSQFEVALDGNGPGGFRIRFYELDGTDGTPGSIIWQSPIQIFPYDPSNITPKVVSVDVPSIAVPDLFAWVVLSEMPAGNMVVKPGSLPAVGESFQPWFRRAGQNWIEFRPSGGVYAARINAVPEPSTLLLLGIGAISLLGYRKAKSHG